MPRLQVCDMALKTKWPIVFDNRRMAKRAHGRNKDITDLNRSSTDKLLIVFYGNELIRIVVDSI